MYFIRRLPRALNLFGFEQRDGESTSPSFASGSGLIHTTRLVTGRISPVSATRKEPEPRALRICVQNARLHINWPINVQSPYSRNLLVSEEIHRVDGVCLARCINTTIERVPNLEVRMALHLN
jgi:hypothetical protein